MFVLHASSRDDRSLDEIDVDLQQSTVPTADLQDALVTQHLLVLKKVSLIRGPRTISIKYIHVPVHLYVFHMITPFFYYFYASQKQPATLMSVWTFLSRCLIFQN